MTRPYPTNNPAGRLLNILSVFNDQGVSSWPLWRVWAKGFGYEGKDRAVVFSKLAKLLNEVDRLEENMKALGHSKLPYYWFTDKIRNALVHPDPLATLKDTEAVFTEDVFYGLEICNDILDKVALEPEIGEEVLKSLYEQSQILSTTIGDTDLRSKFGAFLFAQVTGIARAIEGYKIHGVPGIKSAVERTLGATLLAPPRNLGEGNLYEAVFEWLSSVGSIIGLNNVSRQLPESIYHVLMPLKEQLKLQPETHIVDIKLAVPDD